MKQCLEQFGGGISRIDVYCGYAIGIPPCVLITELQETSGMFDATRTGVHLAYSAVASSDMEMDQDIPASANMVQQPQEQGIINTLTVTVTITSGTFDVTKSVQAVQGYDFVVVFTLMDGTRMLAYLLPGTPMIVSEHDADSLSKVTVTITGKSISNFIRLL